MELTIHIKDKKYITSFLNLLRKFDYIEIIDVKEDTYDIPEEHRMLLDERLKMVEEGKTSFRDWEMVKKKYEGETITLR